MAETQSHAAEGHSTPPGPDDAVLRFLREAMVELSDGQLTLDDIDDDGHIFDFGYADSLSAVMLLARIEDELGVTIEDMDLVENLWSIHLLAERITANR